MHERDTQLVTELPANSSYTRFIMFPLPSGNSFQQYLKEVLARLPEKSLRTVSLGGRDFVSVPSQTCHCCSPTPNPNRVYLFRFTPKSRL